MGGSCHSSIVISSFSCPCFIRVDSWLISWRVVGGTCADILPRDATAETSRTAFAISDRDLRHGSDGIAWRADVFEPRRRAKTTGGEKNGNDNKPNRERFAGDDIDVNPGFVIVPIRVVERRLRSALLRDMILLLRQFLFQLFAFCCRRGRTTG